MLSAGEIMSREFITVPLYLGIDELLRIFSEQALGWVPVVNGKGELVGVVSRRDILYLSLPQTMGLSDYGDIYDLYTSRPFRSRDKLKELSRVSRVEEVMTTDVVVITEETPVVEICRLMMEHNIHYLPVVKGRLVVGVVSQEEIVRAIVNYGITF
ncbi:MAG: CBS domain-containing protein [Acidobacteria bacterium]|nr:CBS domain-containing protein [Acidobacteriota bacterium]